MSRIHKCDRCSSIIELCQLDGETICLACDCPHTVAIVHDEAVPEAWKR